MKLLDLFKKKDKAQPNAPPNPILVIAYKNGEEKFRFNSNNQSSNTLDKLLNMFNVYQDYKIVYSLHTRKAEIFFTTKKTADVLEPPNTEKEGKKK